MTKTMRAEAGNDAPEPRIRARNKERILRAAVDLFADKSFHGTHVKEIAQASGLPKTNVYYYFPTKESIYTAVIERLIEGWDRAFEHIVPEREPREAIAAYIRAKLEYSRRHAAESRFFANEILRGAQFLERRQRQHIRDVTTQRAHVVEEWIRRGQMAPVDPRHFFIMLWSATQFYADFGALAADVLEKRSLTKKDFDARGGDDDTGHPGRVLRSVAVFALKPGTRLDGSHLAALTPAVAPAIQSGYTAAAPLAKRER